MNEALFVAAILVNLLFIALAARFGRVGLVLAMAVNLILVSTFAPKLVTVFGFVSNVGNIFYGSLFIAANILVERYGTKAAFTAIWMSFAGNIFFVVMSQFALRFIGETQSLATNDAISTVFASAPRTALASVVAYLLVQHFNVWLYSFVKAKTGERLLWLRHISSTTTSQLLDSVIFFSIAFYAVIPNNILVEAMIVGFVLKTAIGVVGTPLLYFVRLFIMSEIQEKEDGYVT
ncbi:queuosine precursor transporter [Candidatus Kaiserbacteria bacterium]|nr:queuosine precursor transporter [Candidatus Kaiserbacteria bacterium]